MRISFTFSYVKLISRELRTRSTIYLVVTLIE